MAKIGLSSSARRDALQKALPRLYKFALVLSANEELARALLRATAKALNTRHDWREEDRDRLTGAFQRMHALWSAKMGEDPAIQQKCPPDPRIFAASLAQGPAGRSAQFARFIANMPSSQRAALYLVYGEGASYDEAAEVTALNMLALMKLLARGHLALTQWLAQRGPADEADCLDLDPYMDREHAV
jgi:RNA polymerase sigma-70 factor, ECF subfamily